MCHSTGKHNLNDAFGNAFFTDITFLVTASLHGKEVAQRQTQATEYANSDEIATTW